jgi:hypothetical protein
MIEYGQWDTKTKSQLLELRDKMMVFERKLRKARNKLLSHNDLSTILQTHDLGDFDKDDDTEYFHHLCKFASIVREAILSERFLYDDLVRNDVDIFMACFNRGMIRR